MNITRILLASLCGLLLSAQAQAADRAVYFPFQEAVQRAEDDGFLAGSVTFHLAGTSQAGTVLQADAIANRCPQCRCHFGAQHRQLFQEKHLQQHKRLPMQRGHSHGRRGLKRRFGQINP